MKKRRFAAAVLSAVLLGGILMLWNLSRPANITTDRQLDGLDTSLCEALYYASLAPSSHNTQCWQVTVTPDKIHVALDESRALDVTDPSRRELYLSVGCYLETLCTALDACGYDASVTYADPMGEAGQAASVAYRRRTAPAVDTDVLACIRRRHSDKSAYEAVPLDEAAVRGLLARHPGVVCCPADTPAFSAIQTGTIAAMTAQAAQPAYRAELNRWLRFSNHEVSTKKDGLTPEMLGMQGIMKGLYLLTTSHRTAEGDIFARQGIAAAQKQVTHCAAFFAVTGDNTPQAWVEAGRSAQAFWLDCTALGISLHPMSALIETAPDSAALQAEVGANAPVQLLFRAGYTRDYGQNAAVRRDLRDYISVSR